MTRERWWSWNADLPAEMRHLGSGFAVTPLLYAASAGRSSRLPPGEGVVFGERPMDESEIRLDLSLAGTRLDWRYAMNGDGGLAIDWRTVQSGEWGLRFWVLLCFHSAENAEFRYDRESGALEGRAGGHRLRAEAEKAPLLVTCHEDLEALEAELAERGYFYLGSRGTEGAFVALRFNLEEAPELRVEVSADGAVPPAVERLTADGAFGADGGGPQGGNLGGQGLPGGATAPGEQEPQQALKAVHDVMAWNHVYDFVNERPYTGLSRFWNSRKFGGFGVWLNDVLYNAWLWSHFDGKEVRDNLDAVFAWQTEQGNLPCLVTGNDAWLDRSQPPIGSYVVWTATARSGRLDLLEDFYPGLLRNYQWWWETRQLGETGLLAYGTTPDVGDGLYKGTKLAAKDESTMDNSPVHDPVPFDPERGLLLAADIGLNSLAALEGEVMAMIAGVLGRGDERGEIQAHVDQHKARIAEWLWDVDRQVFASRLEDGGFVMPLAPTSFYPLAAGIGSAEQVAVMVEKYLNPEYKFGGYFGLPSITRDDPAYRDNVYWRGRIWGPLNFWTYQGLRRAGRALEAATLADKSWRLFALGWKQRMCGENYNAENGRIDDQPDSDGFYSWGALLPALKVSEHLDVSPWAGWSIKGPPPGTRMGPLLTPTGRCYLYADANGWRFERENGEVLLETNLRGRISRLTLDAPSGPGAFVQAVQEPNAWIAFPNQEVAECRLGDQVLEKRDGRFFLPRTASADWLRGERAPRAAAAPPEAETPEPTEPAAEPAAEKT